MPDESMLPELRYVSKPNRNLPNLDMYIKKSIGRYKSTSKRMSELKNKKTMSISQLKKIKVGSPIYSKVNSKAKLMSSDHL